MVSLDRYIKKDWLYLSLIEYSIPNHSNNYSKHSILFGTQSVSQEISTAPKKGCPFDASTNCILKGE